MTNDCWQLLPGSAQDTIASPIKALQHGQNAGLHHKPGNGNDWYCFYYCHTCAQAQHVIRQDERKVI